MLPEPKPLPRALSFDDVIVMPGGPLVLPDKVSLETGFSKTHSLKAPLLGLTSSATDAIGLAQQGLIGILSDLPFGEQINALRQVKRHQAKLLRQPHTVTPDTNIAEAQDLQTRYQFSALPVVDPQSRKVVGIVTRADIAKAADWGDPVSHVMVTDLLSVREDTPDADVQRILQEQMIGQVLVLDDKGQLVGLRTASDYAKRAANPFANLDTHGRLLVGVAVSAGPEAQDHISALLDMGADLILISDPYAHSAKVHDLVTYTRRQRCEQPITVIAGHVDTADGARAMIDAGADMLWVRNPDTKALLATGIGVPGFTAAQSVIEAASLLNIPVWLSGQTLSMAIAIKALALGVHGFLGTAAPDALSNWSAQLATLIGQTGATDLKSVSRISQLAVLK